MRAMSRMHPRKRARRDREGVVLLITAFVLMLVSATAVYAVQQGAFEVRAAGAARQALRTKYVSESFVMASLACLEQEACRESNGGAPTNAMRDKYGLPPKDAANNNRIFTLTLNDWSSKFAAAPAPSDADLSGGGFVTAYTPSSNVVIEEWMLEPKKDAQTPAVYRYVATCYGETALAGDTSFGTETRGIHESISISRAYYTKR